MQVLDIFMQGAEVIKDRNILFIYFINLHYFSETRNTSLANHSTHARHANLEN